MVSPRRVAALLAVLACAAGVASASARSAGDAPTGLRAFLLRVDEPRRTAFPRTPSFAWNPVPGAKSYEFQLSTSNAFRESGIVWRCPSTSCPSLPTPVAASSVSLPWITGSPHGLYARARAVFADGGKSSWSASLGLDIVPPTPPTPLASRPGLLRWTPVAGAGGYDVWLVDAKRTVRVYSNVLDEREFYTFHRAPEWIGSVRWRVRALRWDWGPDERVNAIPVTQYGAWSPIYRSTNATPPNGKIALGSTVSDVVSNGRASDPAHRLTPAFTWSGNETLDGTRAELYRVYAFTDRQCLNRVYTGAVVGSPAYAARPYGGLSLPTTAEGVVAARGAYAATLDSRASERAGATFDGELVLSVESRESAKPTTTLPASDGPPAGAGTPTAAAAPTIVVPQGTDLGAPVSLWDDEWPQAGYYWTVVGVEAQSPAAAATTLAAAAPAGSRTVSVTARPEFGPGEQVRVGTGVNVEILTIASVSRTLVTFSTGTLNAHAAGEPIVRADGTIVYQDLELAQDVCAAGRVARFGVNSEPTLVAGDDPFASGLAPGARVTSAVRTASFFRSPLVAWTPALGATAYQVQWSKKASPFRAEPGPDGSAGVLTPATAYVLPLEPGTWYYRVRGFDWSLPTGAQAMGWSEVAKLTITKPTLRVVGATAAKTNK